MFFFHKSIQLNSTFCNMETCALLFFLLVFCESPFNAQFLLIFRSYNFFLRWRHFVFAEILQLFRVVGFFFHRYAAVIFKNYFFKFDIFKVSLCASSRAHMGCVIKYVCYCSPQLIFSGSVCGHTSTLSCKKVSEAHTVISFVNLPC